MKRFPFYLSCLAVVLALSIAIPIAFSGASDGQADPIPDGGVDGLPDAPADSLLGPPVPVADTFRISGISRAEKGTLALAVDKDAKIAFPSVMWSLWLSKDTHVRAVGQSLVKDDKGLMPEPVLLLDADLTAGTYEIPIDDAPLGQYRVTWIVGGVSQQFNLTVVSGTAGVMEYVKEDDFIKVAPGFLKQEEKEIALGCIVLALVPSLFILPYWMRKKDDDYYHVF